MKVLANISLLKKIPLLIFIILLVILGLSFNGIIILQRGENTESARVIAAQTNNLIDQCIHFSMINGDMDAVEQILENTSKETSIFQVSLLSDELDLYAEGVHDGYKSSFDASIAKTVKSTNTPQYDMSSYSDGALTYYQPLELEEDCLDCHEDATGKNFGILVTTISTEETLQKQARDFINFNLMVLGIVLLTGSILFFVIRSFVVKPLNHVVDSMKDWTSLTLQDS